MGDCDFCGKHEYLLFHCRHCGKCLCSDHRLPENHNCFLSSNNIFKTGFKNNTTSRSNQYKFKPRGGGGGGDDGGGKRYRKKSYNRSKHTFKKYNKPFLISIGWIVLVLLLWLLQIQFNYKIDSIIITVFMFISLVIGFYNSYSVTMWLDRRFPNTDFGIWIRRIFAGILSITGLVISAVIIMTIGLTLTLAKTLDILLVSTGALGVGFFIGLMIFSAYLEFTFERRAGILVFQGRQRF